jgi:hypothetical protein
MAQASFILRNLVPDFMDRIAGMEPLEAYHKLHKYAYGDLAHCVSVKYGTTGRFQDRIDVNASVKSGREASLEVLPRKGYRIFRITFA